MLVCVYSVCCECVCILSFQLLNGCQQKTKSVSGEEFSEIEEKLRETASKLSAMEQERDEISQENYELKQQVQKVCTSHELVL